MSMQAKSKTKSKGLWFGIKTELQRHWQLYLMLLLPVVYIIIFAYLPMAGISIAFREYSLRSGMFGDEFVGLKYFRQFFSSPMFSTVMKNTLIISFYSLLVSFPTPIILAVFLNEIRSKFVKKTIQTVTYAPYFISTVVMVGIILQVLHMRIGVVNNLFEAIGLDRIDFMGKESYFRTIYVLSNVWQTTGFSAVIYIAALGGVDPSLVEASVIDGASRMQKIIHIDLPCIAPTIVIQLILAVGSVMNIGFDKIFLMQSPVNLNVSEIISTLVYKRGIEKSLYSFATAVGLFNSVINLVLLFTANFAARKISDNEASLW
ncbi:MAG: ABC transporter permease [Oscillospiraceae bacterium]